MNNLSKIFKIRQLAIALLFVVYIFCFAIQQHPLMAQKKVIFDDGRYSEAKEMNTKANGFKGIWYMNQPSNDKYVYKYSGGMATYTAKHQPLAVYAKEVDKTFFCFGGTDEGNTTLFHNVSYYDHKKKRVANPTILLDKRTNDAHDNPVISLDDNGYVWIFSTSHGTSRPSYIYKSEQPYNIDSFEKIEATEIKDGAEKPFNNFSYFQVWHVKNEGFLAMFTRYSDNARKRIIGYNTSKDGIHWNEWKEIARIDQGHYQISGEHNGKIATAFNYHPEGKGLNFRTNLYYLQTTDFGKTWTTAHGDSVQLPLQTVSNPAMVEDFESDNLICYLKDLNFDKEGNPILMVISSKGYQAGPQNDPRTWEVFHHAQNGWDRHKVTISDNNYDMGSIYTDSTKWRIIAPTITGPQDYNPGGEVVLWESKDQGLNWTRKKQLTVNSFKNHNYVRRPVNAHADFYGLWADGHGRQPSDSKLFFCDKEGNVFQLPETMNSNYYKYPK